MSEKQLQGIEKASSKNNELVSLLHIFNMATTQSEISLTVEGDRDGCLVGF